MTFRKRLRYFLTHTHTQNLQVLINQNGIIYFFHIYFRTSVVTTLGLLQCWLWRDNDYLNPKHLNVVTSAEKGSVFVDFREESSSSVFIMGIIKLSESQWKNPWRNKLTTFHSFLNAFRKFRDQQVKHMITSTDGKETYFVWCNTPVTTALHSLKARQT